MNRPSLTDPLAHWSTDQALTVLQLVHYLEQAIWDHHGHDIGQAIAAALHQQPTTPSVQSPTPDEEFDLPF